MMHEANGLEFIGRGITAPPRVGSSTQIPPYSTAARTCTATSPTAPAAGSSTAGFAALELLAPPRRSRRARGPGKLALYLDPELGTDAGDFFYELFNPPGGGGTGGPGSGDPFTPAAGRSAAAFDVYVSLNGGPFVPWLTGTTATSAPVSRVRPA